MGVFLQAATFAIAFVGGMFIYAKIIQAIGNSNLKQKNVIYKNITAAIGVPVHEIGHLIMCILFFCQVREAKLLVYDNNVATGRVRYSYNENSFFHKAGIFFIASGPLFSASIATLFVLYFISADPYTVVFPENFSLNSLISYIQPDNWRFWVGALIILSIASHVPFSEQDVIKIKESAVLACLFLFMLFLITSQTKFSDPIFEFIFILINMSIFFLIILLLEFIVLFIIRKLLKK